MHSIVRRFLKVVPVLMVVGAVALPRTATVSADAGGGIVIEGNFGGDPKNLNPVLQNDASSNALDALMFPTLVGIDPKTTDFVPNAPGSLAASWKVSDDQKTYTFTLRKGLMWTDGTPITAKDVEFTYAAIANKTVASPLAFVFTANGGTIDSVKALDDQTVEIKYSSADCRALNNAGQQIIPAHLFKADFSDLNDSQFSTNPTVSAGVFNFQDFVPSQRVTMIANPNYADALDKTVKPEGFIYKAVADQNVEVEQFLAGEVNVIDNPPEARRDEIKKAAGVTVFDYPGNSWDYIGLNLADPTNPQPAYDAKGKPIDQGHHPLFGDVAVRQALARAINVPEIIKTAALGYATQMATGFIPSSWAYDKSLAPIAFDAKAAGDMLDKAGFPMGPDGVRVAKGAKYAKDGTPFKFTLITNQGNSRREKTIAIIQSQLKDIGIQVTTQSVAFNTLIDTFDSEKYDAFDLGWLQGFPDDPDLTQILGSHGDIPGSSNQDVQSYINPTFDDLLKKALTIPGCKHEDRAPIYHQIGQILQADLPYLFLFARDGQYAAQNTITGFNPLPSQLFWNVDAWTVKSAN